MPEWLRDWLDHRYLGNTAQDWLIAAGVTLCTLIAVRLFKALVVNRLRRLAARTATRADDIIIETLDDTKWFFYVAIAVLLGSRWLELSKTATTIIDRTVIIVTFIQIGIWMQSIIRRSFERWAEKRGHPGASTMAAAVAFISRLVIWSIILLLVLSNLGLEISALIAGLGVGGVAAALAVQNLLGDMFASLSIYFDRPFDIGDFIIVDDYKGTIERVGMRSTRIASLGGEQLIFSNADIIKSRIRNYRRMNERRIDFRIGIEYNLPAEKVGRVPALLKEAVENVEGVRFDRAHFQAYGDYSLVFEIVYFVLSPDYAFFMDKQQEINFGIYRRFEQAGIPFAFPSRTIYVRGERANEEAQEAEGRLVARR